MYIDVKGVKLFATTGGKEFDAAQPTVIFLHGAALDHTTWALQSRYFAHHGRNVFALDLPGNGKSGGDFPDSIDALADWVIAFMDALGVEKAAIVGHSMGALTALSVAGRYPDRVRALALVGIAYPMMVGDDFLNAAEKNDPIAYEMMIDWSYSRPSHMGTSEVPGLWMLGGARRIVQHAGDDILYKGLSVCKNYTGGLEAAGAVTCPTRFILGDKDMMTMPRAASKLVASIQNSDTVMLKDCGHMQMIEKADELRSALKGFI